jgi:hypothetical protein
MCGLAVMRMNRLVAVPRVGARLLGRITCFCMAAAVIAICPLLWLGPPSPAREYRQDEIARFSPTVRHGLVQLVGETLLLSGVVYASRRWLRIRL